MEINKCVGCDCQQYEKCGRHRECECNAGQVCALCYNLPVKDSSAAYKKLLLNLEEHYGRCGEE